MPVTVEVPEVGTVEFPDGMKQEEMEAALREQFSPKKEPSEQEFRQNAGQMGYPLPASGEERAARDAEVKRKMGIQEKPSEAFSNLVSGSPATAINYAMGKAGELATGVANVPSRLANIGKPEAAQVPLLDANAPKFTIPQIEPEQMQGEGKATQLAAGAYNKLAEIGTGLTTPGSAFTMATLPAGAAKVAFGTQIAANIPGTVQESAKALLSKDSSLMEKGGAIAAPIAEGWMLKTIVKSAPMLPRAAKAAADAIGKPTLEKGLKNAVSERSTTQVPVGEASGNSPPLEQGVSQPEAPAQAQEAAPQAPAEPRRLAPEQQTLIDDAAKEVGRPVRVVSEDDLDPNNAPFAQSVRGRIATIDRSTGTILINPKELTAWLTEDVPKGEHDTAIRSLLSEENIHLATRDEWAKAYHDSLTPLERKIGQRVYGGAKGQELDPVSLGHELIRQRMQQLARMPVRETIERSLKERWTVKSLLALQGTVRGIRETLGTKASKEGLAILDKVQGNLDAALSVARGGAPGATRKQYVQRELTKDEARDLNSEVFNSATDSEAAAEYRRLYPHQQATSSSYLHDYLGSDISEFISDNINEVSSLLQNVDSTKGALQWGKDLPKHYNQVFVDTLYRTLRHDPDIRGPEKELVSFIGKNDPELIDLARRTVLPLEERRIDFAVNQLRKLGFVDRTKYLLLNDWADFRQDVYEKDPGLYKWINNYVQHSPDIGPIYTEGMTVYGEGPAATRKRRETSEQGIMYLPPVAGAQERPSATEAGASEFTTKKQLAPHAIGFDEAKGTAFRPITETEASNPKALAEFLTEGARKGGSAKNESITHRVTALFDKVTGRVEVVSTYPHGKEVRVGDPTLLSQDMARPHRPLERLLDRYTPIYSVYLSDPVQNFHERFDSMEQFQKEFAIPARELAGQKLGAEVGQAPTSFARPTFAQAPHEGDVGALRDALSQFGSKTGPALAQAIKRKPQVFTKKALQAIDALVTKEMLDNPNVSAEEAIENSLVKIHDDINESKTREGFIERTLGRFAPATPETTGQAQAATPQAQATGARELTVPRFARRGTPPQPGAQPAPLTEAVPGAVKSPEMLTAQEQEFVKRQSARQRANDPEVVAQTPRVIYRQLGAREVPKEPYSMGKAKGVQQTVPEQEGESPAAMRKVLDPAQEKASKAIGQVRAFFTRHDIKRDISSLVDAAQTDAVTTSQEAKRNIQQPSSSQSNKEGQPEPLRAARAINAVFSPTYRPSPGDPGYGFSSPSVKAIAHADPRELPNLFKMTQDGIAKADMLLATPNDATLAAVGLPELTGLKPTDIRKVGRLWKESAEKLGKEVEYAITHFDQPELMQTAVNLREQLGQELAFEHLHGKTTNEVENYLPGLYEGELYNDHSVTFSNRILGKSYGKPKTFANQYEAISAGPYIPKMDNVADIAAHRIRAGHSSILRDQAFNSVLNMTDEVSKAPIAIEAEPSPKGGFQVPGGNLQYELVYPSGGGKPIAVRSGYVKLMNDLFGRSGIEQWIGGKGLLKIGAIEKHTTLAGDVFHLFRMMDYALANAGVKTGFKGGYAALEFAAKDMPEAVRRGVITQAQMDWALNPETLLLDGTMQTLTRKELIKEMQRGGFNVGQIQDAMYKHFLDKWDMEIAGKKIGIGAYNRFLFDKWTRGFMANSAVEELLRLHKANPTVDAREVMKRRVIPDANSVFGSPGKQGLIKNPTLRDLLQLTFLAPGWTGSRIATEAKFLTRLGTYPYVRLRYGKGEANLHMGSIGRTVGRGIVAMMLMTQAINLITRGKTTFQNDEKDHKLDAWIPDFHGGPGHWISPLSVFLETVHDLVRYMASGGKNLGETLTQMASNKLSPIGRSLGVLATGYTPMGQKIPDTTGRFKEAAKALVPMPITVSAATREAGHAIAPKLVAPNPHGALQRQIYSSVGIKSEMEQGLQSQMAQKAKEFMAAKGLKKDTGWQQVQTTDPNYTKLRLALRNGDTGAAKRIFGALSVNRSIQTIDKAMKQWRDAHYTNKKLEGAFFASLSPADKEKFSQARIERQREYENFLQFLQHR